MNLTAAFAPLREFQQIARCALLLVATVVGARAETISLGSHGRLNASLPDSWTLKTERASDGSFDLTLQPPNGVNAVGHITILFPDDGSLETINQVRTEALRLGSLMVPDSTEGRVILKDFNLRQGYGVYSSYTDSKLVGKPPVPGDYKTLSTGIIRLDEGVAAVISILCDDLSGKDFRQMLRTVESLELGKSTPPVRRADI